MVYKTNTGRTFPEKKYRGVVVVPIASLEVDESMEFEQSKRNTVQSLASHLRERRGKLFTLVKIDKDTAKIWRLV